MKYYDGHETVYQRLKAAGQVIWGKGKFEDFFLQHVLKRLVPTLSFSHQPPRALELGCGTGPGACFLAQHGFTVRGIDVSATAIEIARQQAQQRGLDIQFEVQDWLSLQPGEYDLILDSHCLHCVVLDADRARALRMAAQLLSPDGRFLVETMICNDVMRFEPNFVLDPDGALWVEVAKAYCADARHAAGKCYVPHRRLLSPAQIERELIASGLEILWRNIVPADPAKGDPDMFQALCRRTN